MSDTDLQKPRRRFSKIITVSSIAGMFSIAIFGTWSKYDHTAAVVEALGPWIVAMILIYMGVGHLDLRAFLGQHLGDFIGSLIARKPRRKRSVGTTEGDDE